MKCKRDKRGAGTRRRKKKGRRECRGTLRGEDVDALTDKEATVEEIKQRVRADKEEDEEDEIKSWAQLALRREEDVLTLSARV